MYIYANADGKIKEIVNDLALRQANDNINHIYLYCENIPTQGISAGYIRYQLPNGTITTEVQFSLTTVRKIIPYDKKRDLRYFKDYKEYDFYDITIPNGEDEDVENVLSQTGLVRATIRFVDSSESTIYALEIIPFYVEESVVRKTEYINGDQYNYLLKTIQDFDISAGYLKSATINAGILSILNNEGQVIDYTPINDSEISNIKSYSSQKMENTFAKINDNNISTTTAFSSNKIKNMFTAGNNVIITFDDVNQKFVISATTEPVGSVAWGNITGDIVNQTDVQKKLYEHHIRITLKTSDTISSGYIYLTIISSQQFSFSLSSLLYFFENTNGSVYIATGYLLTQNNTTKYFQYLRDHQPQGIEAHLFDEEPIVLNNENVYSVSDTIRSL